jgi:hypothetical protein
MVCRPWVPMTASQVDPDSKFSGKNKTELFVLSFLFTSICTISF